MAEKKINPFVKLGLELGPVILFFVMFGRLKDQTFTIAGTAYSGFIVTTAAFILLIIVTSGILWKLTGHLSRMQALTLVLVILMGGLSVWLNDERFIKMKPTLLYAAFAAILFLGVMSFAPPRLKARLCLTARPSPADPGGRPFASPAPCP